jgi:hypothetical protein
MNVYAIIICISLNNDKYNFNLFLFKVLQCFHTFKGFVTNFYSNFLLFSVKTGLEHIFLTQC